MEAMNKNSGGIKAHTHYWAPLQNKNAAAIKACPMLLSGLPWFQLHGTKSQYELNPTSQAITQLSQPIVSDTTPPRQGAPPVRGTDIRERCPCASGHVAYSSSCLATLSDAVAWKKISVQIVLLQQIGREMNSRECTWNRPQLGNDLLECVFFREHVEKISPFANHVLNPLRV